MKKVALFMAICIIAALLVSCEKEMEFVKVVFKNRLVTNRTYNIVWDGSIITSLAPQADSDTFTVQPGSHILVFKVANSNFTACAPSNPSINAGYVHTHLCSY
jgi:hypothetical protein